MRNERLIVPFAVLAMFGLTACGESDQANQAGTEGEQNAQETEQRTAEAQDTQMQQDQQRTQMAQQQGGASQDVALTVEESPQLGEYLADEQGRPVYMLEADSGGESKCTDQCAEQWPPVVAANGKPSAEDPSIEEAQLDTIQREDGQQQVTYNGHPLYYYVQDSQMGEPSGQQVRDQWGEWYLVTAQGEALQKQQGQSRGSSRK